MFAEDLLLLILEISQLNKEYIFLFLAMVELFLVNNEGKQNFHLCSDAILLGTCHRWRRRYPLRPRDIFLQYILNRKRQIHQLHNFHTQLTFLLLVFQEDI